MNRPPHRFERRRSWVLLVLPVVLLAAHGIILSYVSWHARLSTAVLSGAIILLVVKHVGLLGPVYALFRRRRLRDRP
jgi:membrane protein YdbS with pleckstrin-like domain